MSWKDDADRKQRKREQENSKAKEPTSLEKYLARVQREKYQREKERVKEEFSQNMRHHKAVYVCKIYNHNLPSSGPRNSDGGTSKSIHYHMGEPYESSRQDPDCFNWDIPDNLYRCSKCHKWACHKHIHKDVCQECWDKLK